MANILGLVTVNEKDILEVDADPAAGGGTPAPSGSLAMWDNAGVGSEYIKIGPLDTDWDRISTVTTSGVGQGSFLRLPIYDQSPDGYHIDDQVLQNGFNIDVAVQAQPARSVDIEYRIPNPGNAIATADFILSEGAQTKNGNMTFTNDVIVGGNLTVNGSLTYLNSTNTNITDALITLNKGGATGSGAGVGFEIEENSLITGYLKTDAARDSFLMKAPAAFEAELDFATLTADHQYQFQDQSGYLAMQSVAALTQGSVPFINANGLLVQNNADFFWDNTNKRLGIGVASAPSQSIDVAGTARLRGLGLGVAHVSATGVVSSSAVVLTSEVSGILPIANGGTNSGAALNNSRLMYSNGGAIVEYAALVPAQVYFGAATSGLPAQDISLYWDNTNKRLGIDGSGSPSRPLDVKGTAVVQGAFLLADFNFAKANAEWKQSQVATTTNATTALATIAIPADSEVLLEARIMGRRSGGSAGAAGDAAAYVRTARMKNVAGTVTLLSLQTDYTSEDQAPWDGTIVASGTNAVVNVKGANNNNVDWTVTYLMQVLQ